MRVLLCRSEWRAAVESSGAAAAVQLELLQQQLAALATAQQAQGRELLEQVGAGAAGAAGCILMDVTAWLQGLHTSQKCML